MRIVGFSAISTLVFVLPLFANSLEEAVLGGDIAVPVSHERVSPSDSSFAIDRSLESEEAYQTLDSLVHEGTERARRLQERITASKRTDRWVLDVSSFLDQERLHQVVIWHRWQSADSLEYKEDADIVSRLIHDNYTAVLVDTLFQVYQHYRLPPVMRSQGALLAMRQFHESAFRAVLRHLDGFDKRLKQVYRDEDQSLDIRREAFFAIADTTYVRNALLERSAERDQYYGYMVEASYLMRQALEPDERRNISQAVLERIAWDSVNQVIRVSAAAALSDQDRLERLLNLSDNLCTPAAYQRYEYGELSYGPEMVHCGNKHVRFVAKQRLTRLFLVQ